MLEKSSKKQGDYMKRFTSIMLVVLMAFALVFVSCSKGESSSSKGESSSSAKSASKATKIGFVVINDESDQGYTWNFMNGMDNAISKLKAE